MLRNIMLYYVIIKCKIEVKWKEGFCDATCIKEATIEAGYTQTPVRLQRRLQSAFHHRLVAQSSGEFW